MAEFPRLRILADRLEPLGPFAEAQAAFLRPDAASVAALDNLLRRHHIGVVAHFYMDPELQGVLSACTWPHIHVSDSLAMADKAVQMVEAGARAVCVAGVDFMSENVRAVLDAAGHGAVPVYRLDPRAIGCSLAEAAEAPAYKAFLRQAASSGPALHVIYINTSLRTKALAQAIVPTITCTSSNVVQTIFAAVRQIPGVQIWYGPDTYMGENLRTLFSRLKGLSVDDLAQAAPGLSYAAAAKLGKQFHPFQQGNCIVHHLFGADVVARVARDYGEALLTAHLEVPGEMFALAADAQRRGRGVVGSTSQILEFLTAAVRLAIGAGERQITAVLGTEAGMITSIVRQIQAELQRAQSHLAFDIVFPVAADAIATTADAGLPLVPGVAGGEGCSVAGGCATCPYMKMNSLDRLLATAEAIGQADLAALAPVAVQLAREAEGAEFAGGLSLAAAGAVPILEMRHFQRSGNLSAELVADVLRRAAQLPVAVGA